MAQEIKIISLGGVNCYLVKTGSGHILIDSGMVERGDMGWNRKARPGALYIDDLADFNASIEKLKKLNVKIVYPGHGKPFSLERFIQ